MDREAWHAAVHGGSESWTRLTDRTELNIYNWFLIHVFPGPQKALQIILASNLKFSKMNSSFSSFVRKTTMLHYEKGLGIYKLLRLLNQKSSGFLLQLPN